MDQQDEDDYEDIVEPEERGFEPEERGFEPVQRDFEPAQRGFESVQRVAEPVQRDFEHAQRGGEPAKRGGEPSQRRASISRGRPRGRPRGRGGGRSGSGSSRVEIKKHPSVFKRKLQFQGRNSEKRFEGSAREYVHEIPYQLMRKTGSRGRGRGRRRTDDTRSMFDNPQLQRVKMHSQKQVLEAISGQLIPQSQFQWSPLEINDRLPKKFFMTEPFREVHGPRNIEQINTEYDAFRLFFDDEVFKHILQHTHQYYHERFKKEVYFYCTNQKGRRPRYENTISQSDIEGYISLYLYFGIVKLRNTADYWSKEAAERKEPGVHDIEQHLQKRSHKQKKQRTYVNQNLTRIMSKEKYKYIKQFLRFGPKVPDDPIGKIRELINILNRKFQFHFYPGEWICIDEGMIPFNGKVAFKIFNPGKPTKWGIKEYVLSDAASPYTLRIKLHDGVDDDADDEANELIKGKITNLVLQLVQDYEHKSHKLVMDNYYNSPSLFVHLKQRGIGAIGTLRHNRTGLTKAQIKDDYFNRIFDNQRIYYLSHDHELTMLYFQGSANHPVAFLNSFMPHDHTSSDLDLQSLQLRPRRDDLPQLLTFYNKFKGGVDRRNGFCASMRRKGENESKWFRSVFWRLVETCVVNAYLIFKEFKRDAYKQASFQDFRIALLLQLSERYKAGEQNVDQAPAYQWVKNTLWINPNSHLIHGGLEVGTCVQCKKVETQDFCEECSTNAQMRRVVFVCPQMYCRRFHRYSDFEMNVDFFERNQMTKRVKQQQKKLLSQNKNRELDSLQQATQELEQNNLKLLQQRDTKLGQLTDLIKEFHDRTKQEKVIKMDQESSDNRQQFFKEQEGSDLKELEVSDFQRQAESPKPKWEPQKSEKIEALSLKKEERIIQEIYDEFGLSRMKRQKQEAEEESDGRSSDIPDNLEDDSDLIEMRAGDFYKHEIKPKVQAKEQDDFAEYSSSYEFGSEENE